MTSIITRYLLDLGDDAVICLAELLLRDDHHNNDAEGTRALARLCCTCSHFRGLGSDLLAALARRLALERWRSGVGGFEEYAVLATLMAIGGGQLRFGDAKLELTRSNANAVRMAAFARLLRRHKHLHVHIEGHAGVNAPDRAAGGFSLQRAKHVGILLAARRCEPTRLHMRGWGKTISTAAQWPAGAQSRRADVFFTLGDHSATCTHLPPRPPYYSEQDDPGRVSVVSVDRFFFDEVAQELMAHPRLQHAFRSLHGQPQEARPAIMARLVAEDAELKGLYEQGGALEPTNRFRLF